MSHRRSAKGETRTEEPTAAERAIARRAAEARATIPDLELSAQAEMRRCLDVAEQQGVSLTAMLVRACARAVPEVPRANGAYRDGRFELYPRINVGVVLAGEQSHVTATVFDADTKTLRELTDELAELADRAAQDSLRASELAGATFTLWNAGELGIERAGTVIGPAQAAALVAGAVREVARTQNGALALVPASTLTLACDHRILYGARAARFLSAVRSALERMDAS